MVEPNEEYTKAIAIDSNDADNYVFRGLIKNQIGQKESACIDLSKARDLGEPMQMN